MTDTDGDGFADVIENLKGTDSNDPDNFPKKKWEKKDSDNDGFPDKLEKKLGSDPNDENDTPNMSDTDGGF